MAYLYYTVAAILLYLLSDWILNKIEQRVGKRLKYRSMVFFVIIMVLAVGLFEMIDRIVGEPPQAVEVPDVEVPEVEVPEVEAPEVEVPEDISPTN